MSEKKKKRVGRYPAEVRERTVRMVLEHEHEYPSQWKAVESISAKLGINHQTLRNWVNRAETDPAGNRVCRLMSVPGRKLLRREQGAETGE